MTTKQILFAALCVLLLLVIIMSAVVISRVATLFPSLNAPSPSTDPSAPSGSQSTEPSGSISADPSGSTGPTETTGTHVHNFVLSEKLNATCTEYGWNVYTCSDCGHIDMPQDERVDPLGHNYTESKAVAPTCTEGGYTEFKCTRCASVEHRNETGALGHLFDKGTEVPATCEQGAYILFACTREGCEETKQEALNNSALGEHRFGDWVLNTDGTLEIRTCQVCGKEESRTPETYNVNHRKDHGPDGITVHTLTVGPDKQPPIHTYLIFDYTDNSTLSATYDAVRGLVVTYVDAAGELQTVALGTSDVTATLDENGLQINHG